MLSWATLYEWRFLDFLGLYRPALVPHLHLGWNCDCCRRGSCILGSSQRALEASPSPYQRTAPQMPSQRWSQIRLKRDRSHPGISCRSNDGSAWARKCTWSARPWWFLGLKWSRARCFRWTSPSEACTVPTTARPYGLLLGRAPPESKIPKGTRLSWLPPWSAGLGSWGIWLSFLEHRCLCASRAQRCLLYTGLAAASCTWPPGPPSAAWAGGRSCSWDSL